MPKKKILKKEERENISNYLSMRQVWIGLFIVVIALFIGAKGVSNFISKSRNVARDIVALNHPKLTPELIPAVSTVSGELQSPTPTSSLTQEVKQNNSTQKGEMPKVTMLANTTGDGRIFITAQDGDSVWKITQRVCGSGEFYKVVERFNGLRHRKLHVGYTIEVFCHY